MLKYSSNVISSILAEIINISISTGMYPTKLKMAKIILFLKLKITLTQTTIVLFLCCLTLRWLDRIFLGGYLPSLSINYVAVSKDMEKRLPQLYYIKMKLSFFGIC